MNYIHMLSLQVPTQYMLFYNQCFFSSQPQRCLSFSWIELQMLLRYCLIYTYKHHHYHEIILIFTIWLPFSYHLMNADTIFLFLIVWKIPYYFWMITWMKNVNNSKSSTSGCNLAFDWFFPILVWCCL